MMKHNIMQFVDTFIKKIGTAMGTSYTVIFDNLYYAWYEKTTLLSKYQYDSTSISTSN